MYIKTYRVKPTWDLAYILLGTLKGGFEFNSEHKKNIEELTRDYLRGNIDVYGNNFPASHLIPWADEAPVENYYVFTEPVPCNKTLLEEVKIEMEENMIKYALIRDIDIVDYFYLLSNKKTNHFCKHKDKDGKETKFRTKTNYEARANDIDISFPDPLQLEYLFEKVETDPATSRLAGLLTVQGRNLSYIAHTNLDLITLGERDEYKVGINPKLYNNLLTPEGEDEYFIMVDFKKSGLTTNREIVKSVYNVASKLYPGFRPFECYLEALDHIYVNGQRTKRGTSLGIDDNSISFFLSNAFDVFKRKETVLGEFVQFAKFKGDDQVIKLKCEREEAQIFFAKWLRYLTSLGFLINAKKSMLGKRGQFCEVVGGYYATARKTSEFAMTALDSLGCYNMVEFKQNINAFKIASDNNWHEFNDWCINYTINLVKPEFDYNERVIPFEMGGFFSNIERGINLFLIEASEGLYDKVPKGYWSLVGVTLPITAYERKRSKIEFEVLFEDTKSLFSKPFKVPCRPMDKRWKEAYDNVLYERQKRWKNPEKTIKGVRWDVLRNTHVNMGLPLSYLQYQPMDHHLTKLRYKRRFTKKKGTNWQLWKKMKNQFYYIDEIRAKLLLDSHKNGNIFKIKYYDNVPIKIIIHSLCKTVCKSDYALPIAWAEIMKQCRVKWESFYLFYKNRYQINIAYYIPYNLKMEKSISLLFRGPENSDTLMICPFTGFPVKFNGAELESYLIDFNGQPQVFYDNHVQVYFQEWYDPIAWIAWLGTDRNYWTAKSVYEEIKEPVEQLIHNQYYYFPEEEEIDLDIYDQYMENLTYLSEDEYVKPPSRLVYNLGEFTSEEEPSSDENDTEESEDSEDLFKGYLERNPLNIDDEEHPVEDFLLPEDG